jgi:hypothetical protein
MNNFFCQSLIYLFAAIHSANWKKQLVRKLSTFVLYQYIKSSSYKHNFFFVQSNAMQACSNSTAFISDCLW